METSMQKSVLTRAICLVLALISFFLMGCTPVQPSESESSRTATGAPSTDTPIADAPLTIQILNTGKSDCCVVFYEEYTILIDTADSDDLSAIRKVLSDKGRIDVDLMILTHYDNDHVGSAGELIGSLDVKEVIGPDYDRKSFPMAALDENLAAKGGELKRISENAEYRFGDLSVSVSAPKAASYSDENDYSLITTLTFGEKKLLFLGDACNIRLKEFYREADTVYDFVKLPHHGDYESAMQSIFLTSKFGCAVLCEAEKEDSRLTTLLENYSVQTFRTYDGTVTVRSDGAELTVVQ